VLESRSRGHELTAKSFTTEGKKAHKGHSDKDVALCHLVSFVVGSQAFLVALDRLTELLPALLLFSAGIFVLLQ
jgi:hypothetical protein